jgi:hypothetical protein
MLGIGVYVGDWENHKMHGWGKMTYADGTVYKGGWENGFELEEDDEERQCPAPPTQRKRPRLN